MADVSDWTSIADLARQRGVSRQSLAERVDRLVRLGSITTRPGPGRAKLVNVVEFDKAAAAAGDAQRALNGGGASAAPELAREQARRAKFAADNEALDFAERVGDLTPMAEVRDAAVEAIGAMRAAFGLAVTETADVAARDLGIEAARIRPHLREMERRALAAFTDNLSTIRTARKQGDA